MGLDLWNCGALAFSILLVLWGLFMDMDKAKRLRILARIHSVPVALWRWTATWKWDGIFSAGWGLMLASGEYALSLVCLGLATLGAFSGVTQWCRDAKKSISMKVVSLIGIAGIAAMLVLVTIANKGDKPWSPTLILIDSRLAERVPLPSPPFPDLAFAAPLCRRPIVHTDKKVLAALSREIELQKRESVPTPPIVPDDKAHFDASFWPALLAEWPIQQKAIPVVNGVVTVTLTFMVKDHMAKKTTMWLRLCRGCKYAQEPQGFKDLTGKNPTQADDTNERVLNVGDFLPNVAYAPIITVGVIPPAGQTYFDVGVQVGCENCDPVDANGFKVLRVDIQQ